MLDLVRKASNTLKGVVARTPLVASSSLSRLYGVQTHLKLENLQKTGSFKVRGAYNLISSLSDEEKSRGVVTASLGNHAQGVAWAGALLGVKATVVMPRSSSIIKRTATSGYGAEVVLHGGFFDEADRYAKKLAEETGRRFIPPFDDDLVIAGQGTVALEILEDCPDADTIVVPIGGGGLISGIASTVKESGRDMSVIGVEAAASMSCIESLKAGRPVDVEHASTIADGIAVKRVGEKTFALIKKYVDDVVAVSEDSIAGAVLALLERKKVVAEGAGAASVAAAIEGRLPASSKKIVFVISGGNMDVTVLDRVIRTGLLKEGRVIKVETVLRDVPGSLAELTAVIASQRANILHIVHLRDAEDAAVGLTRLDVLLEVEGPEHAQKVIKSLVEKGYKV